MRPSLLPLCLLLISCGTSAESEDGQLARITVSAGAVDRINTIVSFAAPESWPAGLTRALLIDENRNETALQRGPGGYVWFSIDSMKAEQTRTYRVVLGESAPASQATADVSDTAVVLHSGRHEVLTYHFAASELPRPSIDPIYRRGGYIHPVLTPSGVLVTDDYPPNHLHHHGIWSSWTRTRFSGRSPDFWNMGDGTGTVEAIGLDSAWSGPVHAGVRARNRFVDLSGPEDETVLLETWETRVYPQQRSRYNVFDVHIIQVAATDSALVLPEYHYGGVGFRGHRQWNGADEAVFLTSEGRDRTNGHATTARWCHVGGKVDGQWAGVAILGHPENFRAPQPMRIHPDEPFFNFAPSQSGDWAIEPGERYEARYRYVVYDGEPNPEEIDRLWNDYAYPPVVAIEHD